MTTTGRLRSGDQFSLVDEKRFMDKGVEVGNGTSGEGSSGREVETPEFRKGSGSFRCRRSERPRGVSLR